MPALSALSALLCLGVTATSMTPAGAAEPADHRPSHSVQDAGFPIADAIEGTLSERDGAFTFPLEPCSWSGTPARRACPWPSPNGEHALRVELPAGSSTT